MNTAGISIIIATRHRETVLWQTIGKAYEAIEHKNAEIIIVNDGDKPLNIPATFVNKVYYFENPRRGVSSARNYGAAMAKNPIFFFVDDDMWINSQSIDWITLHMANEENRNAVYNINWEYPPGLQEKLSKLKVGRYLLSANYNNMWGRMGIKGKPPASGLYKYHSIASCSLVMHRNKFELLGGYNESLIFQGEDIDLSNRINGLSIPIYAVFDLTLFHNHLDRLEIKPYLERNFNGFRSEFEAIKAGVISPVSKRTYKGPEKIIFEFFRVTEQGWIFLMGILPNHSILTPVSNRLIGILSGLQRYKQWKKVMPG